jgi:NADP-dependent aldehyde dehydrogenase
MTITGDMLIGAKAIRGQESQFRAVNPATGEARRPC